jgi:predicted Rossmann fold flavoprotein
MKDASVNVVVVGAGPAGMMAAIAAAEEGGRVIVCEQMARPGLKLLATGGGRCNLTNTLGADEIMTRFGRQGRFMQPALANMDSRGLRRFFGGLNVPTVAPDGFHVYPASFSSATVQGALVRRCAQLHIEQRTGLRVTGLCVQDSSVRGVETPRGGLSALSVIVATGGRSYPKFGATGGGYELARQAGHTVIEPQPVLTSLHTRETWPRSCTGISIPQAHIRIDLPGCRRSGIVDDVLFTHKGVSGPAILDLSREVIPRLRQLSEVPIRINLRPGMSTAGWRAIFDRWQKSGGRNRVHNLAESLFAASLAAVAIQQAGIPRDLCAATMNRAQREALAGFLTSAPLTVVGAGGFDEAMATRGGICLREIKPGTLESKLTRGLYFAGEVVDLDGPCGGFNLQWAFSSGRLAGTAAGGRMR